MRSPGRRSCGFALAEIMIVVAILGLLAAVALPQFTSRQERHDADAVQLGLAQLRQAVNKYWAQHDGFPGPTAVDVERQLAGRTDRNGQPGNGAATDLGPYVPDGRLPENPATTRSGLRIVKVMPNAPDGLSAWLYCPMTGEVRADATGRNADGVAWFDL